MDSSTMNPAAVFVGCKNGGIELGMSNLSNRQLEEFFSCEQSRPSSTSTSSLPSSFSGGSPEYSSLLNNKVFSSFIPDPSKEPITNLAAQASPAILPPRPVAMQAYSQHPGVQFPNLLDDDDVITRAMMAVISSSSSSPYSSSPSIISETLQEARNHQAHGQVGAFKPYNLALAPKLEPKNGSCAQKMIKKSISIMKRIDLLSAEARPKESRAASSNQMHHHVISERRRREKLNGSFQDLRMMLPPGSKKDKASVLTSTRNYLNTLKAQIYELEDKNRKLEMQLLSIDEAQETTGSSGRVKVHIIKASDLTTELQQIGIGLTVKAECDITALVLHVLERLKAMGLTSLLSVDAYACSSQMNLFARVYIKLQIKASDWNEELFKEAMIMAVDGMTTSSP